VLKVAVFGVNYKNGGNVLELRYSIDMLRLKADVPFDAINLLVLKPFKSEPNVSYKMMTSITSYRHNFYVKDYNCFGEECSFWIGACHNSKRILKTGVADIVVEYNPNKCTGSVILDYVLDSIYRDNQYVEVKSLDVAIDIPCNILDLNISRKGNMSRRIFDNGSDDRTYYFRKGKSNGAIKVYNKKRESKLDYELTRYEITLTPNIYIDKIDSYNVPCELFIDISCISNFQIPLDLKGTDKILLLACMEHPEYLRDLGRDKRKKIEQLLAENCSIDIDYVSVKDTIVNCLKSIYTL
jgi:hypothetical protein